MKRQQVLEAVAWAEDLYGSLISGGRYTRRDLMRCVKAGLVESAGMVVVMDGDFAKDPERYREGFKLTAAGRRLIP